MPSSRPFQPVKLLLCLLATALFWFMNALNRSTYSLNVKYPVRFIYNDSLYIPTLPLPRTVDVNLTGDGWHLLGHSWLPFRTEPIQYVVNNPLQASVINAASLTAALAEQVKNVRVNYIVADTLALAFDQRLTKTIKLVPDSLHINLGPRMVVSSVINLTPATLRVEGPARLVRGFADTLVVRIPGKRISDNYDEELTITNYRHPLIHSSTERVLVSFEVAELLSPLPVEPPKPIVTKLAAKVPVKAIRKHR